MVLPWKWAVGSSMPASLNFALPVSVTTMPRLFGSRWFSSESRKTWLEPEQHLVRWTSISTVTDSLTRLMASRGDMLRSSRIRCQIHLFRRLLEALGVELHDLQPGLKGAG